MKKLIVFALIISTVAAYGQQSQQRVKTRLHSSGYGAVTTNYSKFNGENAMFAGAYGGWLINHKLLIGLGGYALASSHDGYSMENNESTSSNKLKMGYGGLMLGYTFFEKSRLHVTTNVLIGAGAVVNAYRTSYADQFGDHWHSDEESGFRVIEPSINIEYSVTNWFQVAAGGGYRHISGSDMSGISNKSMSAPTANLTLKFGVF